MEVLIFSANNKETINESIQIISKFCNQNNLKANLKEALERLLQQLQNKKDELQKTNSIEKDLANLNPNNNQRAEGGIVPSSYLNKASIEEGNTVDRATETYENMHVDLGDYDVVDSYEDFINLADRKDINTEQIQDAGNDGFELVNEPEPDFTLAEKPNILYSLVELKA